MDILKSKYILHNCSQLRIQILVHLQIVFCSQKLIVSKDNELQGIFQITVQQEIYCHAFLIHSYDYMANLGNSCVCYHNLYEFICASVLLCLEDTAFLLSSITSVSYNLSDSSFLQVPEPGSEGFDEGILFKTEYSKFPHSLYNVNKCSFVFISNYVKKLLLLGLIGALIYKQNNVLAIRNHFIATFLQQNNSIRLSSRAKIYLV